MNYEKWLLHHHDGFHAGQVMEQFYYQDEAYAYSCQECSYKAVSHDEQIAELMIKSHVTMQHEKDLMERMKEE